jgi:hypothetical protein
MKVRLIIENTASGLRATIREKDDLGARLNSFLVESVQQAKQRAKSVARKHGLGTYGVVDRTTAAPRKGATPLG